MKYTKNEIQKIVEDNKQVRINLHLRNPVYGKLVMLSDHEHLMSKGLVRFVINERLDFFEGTSLEDPDKKFIGKDSMTKILSISEFTYIKQY